MTVTSSNQVDQQSVEKVGHVVLLLTSTALAKTFHQQNGLQSPKIWLGVEAGMSKDLRSQDIVNANLILD